MFSLHIDTARTWRGGQNQVLLTVNGLRAIGHRTALVAHPGGELRRRAAEGLELIPIAPRTELDLSAGWRLSRVIRRLAPDIVHAHDPHGVAMAALALSIGAASRKGERPGGQPALLASRRVDFHLKSNSFSRWKHRQVDGFIAASDAIRQMLVGDGVSPERVVTVHEGIDVHRAIVATRAGGIPEIVVDGETGLLVPPRDPAAMAQAIVALLADEKRRRAMGEAGFARVQARFTVDRMVADTAAVYARVAGRDRAADIVSPAATAGSSRSPAARD